MGLQPISEQCPRLIAAEGKCVGSEFQTAGTATWKLRRPSGVRSEEPASHDIQLNADEPDQRC